jgi:tetratricopeptide (TPR) repeat protein
LREVDSSGLTRRATWLTVFGAALLLRLVYLWEWHDTLLFTTPIGDARAYLDWARQIAGGDWLGREVFYQAPLYPYLLAGVLRLTGSETWGPRLVQAVLGALACVWLGRAGERFFDRASGVAAGLGLAFYAPALYFDGLIQKPVLDGALLSALLLVSARALTRTGVGEGLAAGALLGLLALSRENALVAVPLIALWLALARPEESPGRRAATVAALVLGLAVVLGPVALRNHALGGRFLVTTAQAGPNLWIGNHPGASGRYEPLRPGRGSARFERQDAHDLAVAAVGRELTPAEVSDYWRDRALAWVRESPGEWARLMARKAALVWSAAELPDTEGIEAYAEASLLLRVLRVPGSFGVLVPLAVVGALAWRRDWRRLWLLPVLALALAASIALFYVFARYRYVLVAPLVPLGAAGALALQRAFAGDSPDRRAGAGLLAAGAAVALAVNWPTGDTNGVALTHYGVGAALLDADRLAEAQAELERAVAADPSFAAAESRLGDVLRKRGQPARALVAYDRALELDPGLADAHAGRGIALERLGRVPEADAEYARALALDPNHPDANNNSANRLLESGQTADALARYQRALAARPDDVDIATNYGAALVGAGDFARALAVLDGVVARRPDYLPARFDRAAAYSGLGRAGEARAELQAVLDAPGVPADYARAARDALAALGER